MSLRSAHGTPSQAVRTGHHAAFPRSRPEDRWLESKPRLSLDELATRFDRSIERYKRLLRLSYLSPTIITAIIEMRQPPHITNRFLQNLDGLPLSWAAQERLLLG
jgi:hypothetical protein